MRELSLDQLRTLVTIVDLGTFSAAANALHLAQPTISLHVSDLEGAAWAAPCSCAAAVAYRPRRWARW